MNPLSFPEAQLVLGELDRVLKSNWSFKRVLGAVKLWYGQPLHFARIEMPIEKNGCVAGVRDCYLACTRIGLPPEVERYVQFHEIGHVLAGQVESRKNDPLAPTRRQFLRDPNLQREYLRYHNYLATDDLHLELIAEAIGVIVRDRVTRHEQAVMDAAAKLYEGGS
jgi:hypothetical protein